jgi:hypothetical protein
MFWTLEHVGLVDGKSWRFIDLRLVDMSGDISRSCPIVALDERMRCSLMTIAERRR